MCVVNQRLKNLIHILFIIGLVSCKEEPKYNPFDDQFDVSVRGLINDNCDTISAGCGYYNLIVRGGRLQPYYQVSNEDFYQVVAKGFIYSIDTFTIPDFDSIDSDSLIIDSIVSLPLNTNLLNQEFSKFGYLIEYRIKEQICIVNNELRDTINLELVVHRNQDMIRGIEFFGSFEIKNR